MSRLIPEALYSNELMTLHLARDNPREFSIDDMWERAAKNVDVVDPDGKRSLAILRRMMIRDKQDIPNS